MKKLMFIVVLLIASVSTYSQGLDTVWTYNLMPNQLTNAVFSPDEKFVFATHFYEEVNGKTTFYLSKFDKANGKLLWTTDTIMGIKQFSDDGKFFYTYDLKKYSYPEFIKIGEIGPLINNKKIKDYSISEFDDYGVAILYENKIDSNLVIFSPKEMKIIDIISYTKPDGIADHSVVSPTDHYFITTKHISYQIGKNGYCDQYFELWDKQTKNKLKSIYSIIKSPNYYSEVVKYSPDGKLLGILTDSLRLYETGNYNWMYTLPMPYIRKFNFSKDSKNIYLSIQSKGPYIYDINNKILNQPLFFCLSIFFISDNLNELLLTNHGYSLTLLKQIESSVLDSSKFQIKINNNFIQINSNDHLLTLSKIDITALNGNEQNALIKNFSNSTVTIDISSLMSGVYILRILNGSEVYTHKFIIVR